MFYVKQDNEIVLKDNNLQTITFSRDNAYPQYKDLEIKSTDKNIVEFEGKFYFEDDPKLVTIRENEFKNKFLTTSKGNYRLQPKGYSNAQQSVDTINGMVNALEGLTQQIAQMVIFYPTPDFTKEEECTEAWLIAHQYNAEPMTKEEWTDFYIEFSSLYAMNQYKKANEE